MRSSFIAAEDLCRLRRPKAAPDRWVAREAEDPLRSIRGVNSANPGLLVCHLGDVTHFLLALICRTGVK